MEPLGSLSQIKASISERRPAAIWTVEMTNWTVALPSKILEVDKFSKERLPRINEDQGTHHLRLVSRLTQLRYRTMLRHSWNHGLTSI